MRLGWWMQRDTCAPWEGCYGDGWIGVGYDEGRTYCECPAGGALRDEDEAQERGPYVAVYLDRLLLQQGEDGPDKTVPGDPSWA